MTIGIALKNLTTVYQPKDEFYNSLTNCEISDKNYLHVFKLWKVFRMNIMSDYHDLHLKVVFYWVINKFSQAGTSSLYIYSCL